MKNDLHTFLIQYDRLHDIGFPTEYNMIIVFTSVNRSCSYRLDIKIRNNNILNIMYLSVKYLITTLKYGKIFINYMFYIFIQCVTKRDNF